ncbi:cadherin-related family member 5 isoform X1 [Parambassis ranga]|uniref:Cadherin-related family member 5 isoform X1 n=1 Tax=Parambassis ranga TaxID=210632 RepID=A0A6P7KGI5_9TELE|nr:cadherin-related family member 5-like isoform X1 [Parambassis ranga]
MDMDRIHPRSPFFSFLLLVLLQASSHAADICSAASPVYVEENNDVGRVVTMITVNPGVTVEFSPPPANQNNPFRLEGNQLIADQVLDYEATQSYVASIICTETATSLKVTLTIVVLVENVNDNPPTFAENPYRIDVSEMAAIGTTVGRFPATDRDQHPVLYYTLTSDSTDFVLKSATIPELLVNARLDYDKSRNVQLVLEAQDTPLTPVEGGNSFTATTTIMVTVSDSDNRPPWFQPCDRKEVSGAVICQSAGYTGRVVQKELQTGVLPLKPGPLYAIDGDSGINEEIMYSFLSGNDQNLFEINPNTGNISMLKAADRLEMITLTVMAAQKLNNFQFATTTVTISVQQKSLHPPQFEKTQYEGLITSMGQMAVNSKKNEPLQITAKDEDYVGTGGLNPYMKYSVNSSDFSTIQGYIFMTKELPEGTYVLEMVGTDSSNDETARTLLSLEVKLGQTTTPSLPPNTTIIRTTSPTEESTSGSKTTILIDPTSTVNSESTTDPSVSTDGSFPTIKPTPTTEETSSTTSTSHPGIVPSGDYRTADMAALGATLGVLLFVCLVIIGVLVHQMRKGKADWRKIYEASVFRSSLGQSSGGHKEGIQFTNEAFQNDEDSSSTGSGGPGGRSVMAGGESPKKESVLTTSAALSALLPDDTSDMGSDKADSEKEVKPILTKERRMEEGYKSVWFKTDIDPNAKEEVVIIPDSREDDSEADDEEPSFSGREDDGPPMESSKVAFADSDLDSGLGVRMEEPGEDSQNDEVLTADL